MAIKCRKMRYFNLEINVPFCVVPRASQKRPSGQVPRVSPRVARLLHAEVRRMNSCKCRALGYGVDDEKLHAEVRRMNGCKRLTDLAAFPLFSLIPFYCAWVNSCLSDL
jgi:hypothetical protein